MGCWRQPGIANLYIERDIERGQILLVTILPIEKSAAELLFAGARSPVTGCSRFATVMLLIFY
jgi:hypothetical protein